VTYLLTRLIGHFSSDLRPTQLRTQAGGLQPSVTFQAPFGLEAASGVDPYEASVNGALVLAQADPASGLQGQTWTLSEPG
jgi:hypothetical protein